MEGRFGLTRQGSGLWRSLRDGDFEEGDVWDVLTERKDSSFPISNGKSIESSASFTRTFPTAARMIPRATLNNSSSSGSIFSLEGKLMQQSAPVNIPDWSKIPGKKSKKVSRNLNSWLDDDGGRDDDDDDDDGDDFDAYGHGVVNGSGNSDDDDDDYEDDSEYNCKVPPHEFIARRLARTQISSFSVFEGVGRTLKGRDLSRVRNAVLTKTGFLESP